MLPKKPTDTNLDTGLNQVYTVYKSLNQVYTGSVRPFMLRVTWKTATMTNTSKLDGPKHTAASKP